MGSTNTPLTGQQNLLGSINPNVGNAGSYDPIDAQIAEFIKHMNATLDYNDPDVKEVMRMAQTTASNEAKRRGLRGGIVASEAGRQSAQNVQALLANRRSLGMQAAGLATNKAMGLASLGENARQFDSRLAQEAQARQAAATQQAIGALGSLYGGMIGGAGGSAIGGGVAGGLGGLATGYGTPTNNPTYGSTTPNTPQYRPYTDTYRPSGG